MGAYQKMKDLGLIGCISVEDWQIAIVDISAIVEQLTPEDRVKVMEDCFSEWCPKCGLTTIYGCDNMCKCEEF